MKQCGSEVEKLWLKRITWEKNNNDLFVIAVEKQENFTREWGSYSGMKRTDYRRSNGDMFQCAIHESWGYCWSREWKRGINSRSCSDLFVLFLPILCFAFPTCRWFWGLSRYCCCFWFIAIWTYEGKLTYGLNNYLTIRLHRSTYNAHT